MTGLLRQLGRALALGVGGFAISSVGASGWLPGVEVSAPPGLAAAVQVPRPLPWAPPLWFPEESRDALWVLGRLDGEAQYPWGPRVDAHAGILADLDRGEILWARDPDGPRGIASVTKLFSALALTSREGVDLDREICVGFAEWPSRPGARSRFETGDCLAGWDLVGAALVASDNRGAYAFPAIAGEDYFLFLDRMRRVAGELGTRTAEFGDPAGLEDENRASPRDVLKAVTAVAAHPTLSAIASAPTWRIEPSRGARRLLSTNRLLRSDPEAFDTLAAKTGYTDTARFCYATVVRSRRTGRRFGAVVLAAPSNRSRWRDVQNMLEWADSI